MLQNRADVNQKGPEGWTPLHLAAHAGNREIVDALSKVPPRTKLNVVAQTDTGATPMYIASQQGHVNVMDAWVYRMETITTRQKMGWAPLHAAVQGGHLVSGLIILIVENIS